MLENGILPGSTFDIQLEKEDFPDEKISFEGKPIYLSSDRCLLRFTHRRYGKITILLNRENKSGREIFIRDGREFSPSKQIHPKFALTRDQVIYGEVNLAIKAPESTFPEAIVWGIKFTPEQRKQNNAFFAAERRRAEYERRIKRRRANRGRLEGHKPRRHA